MELNKEIKKEIYDLIKETIEDYEGFEIQDRLKIFNSFILKYNNYNEWFSALSGSHEYKQYCLCRTIIYENKEEKKLSKYRYELSKIFYDALINSKHSIK